jgi:hypothetical protein
LISSRDLECQAAITLLQTPHSLPDAAMLSSRGTEWAKIRYAHGAQDRYDPEDNPDGVVTFDNAENVRSSSPGTLVLSQSY